MNKTVKRYFIDLFMLFLGTCASFILNRYLFQMSLLEAFVISAIVYLMLVIVFSISYIVRDKDA